MREWEEIRELVDEGLLSSSTVDIFLSEVMGGPISGPKASDLINFVQFRQIADLLDQAAEAAEGGEEGSSR